jgi:hypothetical protein
VDLATRICRPPARGAEHREAVPEDEHHAAVPEDEHRAFDSLVMVVSWIIWKEQNGRTFNGKARTVSQVVTAVTDELDNHFNAGFRSLAPLVQLMA